MTTETETLINYETQTARRHRQEAERLIAAGRKATDPAVVTELDAAEAALARRDRLRDGQIGGPRPVVDYLQRRGDGLAPRRYAVEGADGLERYLRTGEVDRQTLQVASDGSGGYAVRPTLVRAAFVDELTQNALDLAGAAPIIIDGDAYEEVIVDGDTVEYLPEIPDGTESTNPNVKLLRAEFAKVGGLQFMTEWQRTSESVDLTDTVIRHTVDEVKVAEDAALNGSGIGLLPRGMTNDSAIPRHDIEGTTATTISNRRPLPAASKS